MRGEPDNMRCSRCGRQIPNNNFTRINGAYFCNDCAADMGFSFTNMNFNSLGGLQQALRAMEDLDFANSAVECSNCGTTLREFENTGKLGCISCYNTFSNEIAKRMLRLFGSDEFCGRQPGEAIEYDYDEIPSDVLPSQKEEHKEVKSKDRVDRIAKADFGTLSEEKLQEALEQAVAKEDFTLAARLRDEIKSRKGGQADE